jgi:hypothetical protein
MRRLLIAALLAAGGCGSGGSGASGDLFVAATIDGVAWRVAGVGSVLTTTTGEPSLTILGYTPLSGSKQADDTKPMLDIIFSGVVPTAGTYDVATTSALTVMYMPDRSTIYGADTGSVTISSITSSMVDGTFAFTGSALGVTEALAVTGGSFHVTITRL